MLRVFVIGAAKYKQKLYYNCHFSAGGDAEGLAATLRELENVFAETAAGGRHPVLEVDGDNSAKLFVEGCHCVNIQGDTTEQLLLWGISFAVFSQRLNFPAVRNTATFMAVYILESDAVTKLPKELQNQLGKLLP